MFPYFNIVFGTWVIKNNQVKKVKCSAVKQYNEI